MQSKDELIQYIKEAKEGLNNPYANDQIKSVIRNGIANAQNKLNALIEQESNPSHTVDVAVNKEPATEFEQKKNPIPVDVPALLGNRRVGFLRMIWLLLKAAVPWLFNRTSPK